MFVDQFIQVKHELIDQGAWDANAGPEFRGSHASYSTVHYVNKAYIGHSSYNRLHHR